jgi:hypothetical protein
MAASTSRIEETMRQFIHAILLGTAMLSIGHPAQATFKEPPMENCAGGPPCPWSPAPLPPPPYNRPELPPRLCPGDEAHPMPPSAQPEPLPALEIVVEYRSERGSYFYTIDADEMTRLDAGEIRGWHRTGRSFSAYGASHPRLKPVFRFWIAGMGHVFTHDTTEFAAIWSSRQAQLEGIAFYVSR